MRDIPAEFEGKLIPHESANCVCEHIGNVLLRQMKRQLLNIIDAAIPPGQQNDATKRMVTDVLEDAQVSLIENVNWLRVDETWKTAPTRELKPE